MSAILRVPMRTLLAIVVTACAILMAGIAQNPDVWKIGALLIVATWILHALSGRERRQEHQAAGDVAIDQLIETASAVRQARSHSQDHHYLDLQGRHDDDR